MSKAFLSLLLFLSSVAFISHGQQALTSLEEYKQFQQLSGPPLNSNIGNWESVKVVHDLKSKKTYFINSRIYKYHLDFCISYLKINQYVEEFNRINYGSDTQRDYLLCNVNFNSATGVYFMDLSVFDQMNADYLIQLYEDIGKKSYFKDKLALLLNTERLMQLKPELEKKMKVILPADVFANQTFQRVSAGRAVGILRFEPNLDSLSAPLKPEDILVTHGTPKYFPNVSGILTDEFQTPLSHLSILGKNRKLPVAVDKNLINDSIFRSLEGKWIDYRVTDRGIEFKLSHPKNREESHLSEIKLTVDTTIQELVDVKLFHAVGAKAIGNKAYNFGILETLQTDGKFKTPENAMAIPFYYYLKHVDHPEIQALIAKTADYASLSEDSLRSLLSELRKAIKKAPLDPELEKMIRKQLETSDFTTFRFRSSTNAEDAKGFSGAGLYDSKTVDLYDCDKTIEKALLGVWASLWSYEAFQERRFFRISDKNLAMGVLVHRSFPEEKANGVVITKNVYRPNYKGISVNVQFGDISVVQPPEGVICDQLVIVYEQTASGFDRTVEYITSSNQGDGTVLSPKELEQLEFAVEQIKMYYWKRGLRNRSIYYEDFGLDLEFKFQGDNRELYIKQVRYFND